MCFKEGLQFGGGKGNLGGGEKSSAGVRKSSEGVRAKRNSTLAMLETSRDANLYSD